MVEIMTLDIHVMNASAEYAWQRAKIDPAKASLKGNQYEAELTDQELDLINTYECDFMLGIIRAMLEHCSDSTLFSCSAKTGKFEE
jgi:hypothetical protein